MPQAMNVRGPLAGHPEEFSKDHHAAIIQFDLRGSPETAADRIEPVLAKVASLQRSARGFTIAEFGEQILEGLHGQRLFHVPAGKVTAVSVGASVRRLPSSATCHRTNTHARDWAQSSGL